MPIQASKIALVSLLIAVTHAASAKPSIRILLNWQPQAEQCGFYQALAKGYYSQAGLDVALVTGGPDMNDGLLLASGKVDFSVVDAIETMALRGRGVPVVAVASFFQKDPQTIAAHPDPQITKPEDLRGHPMLISNASRNRFWQWAKARFGYNDDQLHPYSFSGLPFLANPAAAQQGYITNDGYLLGRVLGRPPRSFLLADYGYDNYANVLLTLSHLVEQSPDTVSRIVLASKRGWMECEDGDAAPARAAILKANPSYPSALFDYSLARMREDSLIGGNPGVAVGSMTDKRWSNFLISMKKLGIIRTSASYEGAYTTRFSNP